MSKQTDIIELNGHKYDAKTGAMLGKSAQPQAANPTRVVDGFMKPQSARRNVTPKSPTPSHSVHKKTTKSQTLMRHAVKKPEIKKAAPAHQHAPIQGRKFDIDPKRAHRASQLAKSPHISKFGSVKPTIAPVEVKHAPPAATTQSTPSEHKRSVLPLSPFDMALQKADSHQQQHIDTLSFRKRIASRLRLSPRAMSMLAGMVVVVVGGVYMASQHMPTLAVRLAAARAGVEARLPGYKPAGFSLSGPIEYSSGEITIQYQSNSDDRRFRVVQKKSDWNSQSLLENFITAADKNYQTFQDKGKTIYIYEGANATWVSGGVWYQIEGEASLNSDQLLRIASGL